MVLDARLYLKFGTYLDIIRVIYRTDIEGLKGFWKAVEAWHTMAS